MVQLSEHLLPLFYLFEVCRTQRRWNPKMKFFCRPAKQLDKKLNRQPAKRYKPTRMAKLILVKTARQPKQRNRGKQRSQRGRFSNRASTAATARPKALYNAPYVPCGATCPAPAYPKKQLEDWRYKQRRLAWPTGPVGHA